MSTPLRRRPRHAARRCRGDHRGPRPGPPDANVRLQHDPARQVDRRPAARLPDLDLRRATSRTRRRTRRSRRSSRRRPRRYDVRAALLPAQGAAARARPARALRPLRARLDRHARRPRGTRPGASSSTRTRSSPKRPARSSSRFFDDNWIDGPVRPDKRTGAFCATTVPGVHPYVLMNYTGDRRSILTLAHELGHGLHGVLAQPLGLLQLLDAADDRGDRVGVRGGPHVRACCSRPRTTRAGGSTCSRGGSRTRSRRRSGRSR